jgi:hypothetical protein
MSIRKTWHRRRLLAEAELATLRDEIGHNMRMRLLAEEKSNRAADAGNGHRALKPAETTGGTDKEDRAAAA